MNNTIQENFTLLDFLGVKGINAITLGEEAIEKKLIELANEHDSKIIGVEETRKYVLKYDFRLEDMVTSIECLQVIDAQPEMIDSIKDVAKNYLERAFRCSIPSGAVKEVSSIVAKLLKKYSIEELATKAMQYVRDKVDTLEGFVFMKELQKWGMA